jgi:hypothetical protein
MSTISLPQLAMIHRLWRGAEGLVERHTRTLAANFQKLLSMTYAAFTMAVAAMAGGGQASIVGLCLRSV